MNIQSPLEIRHIPALKAQYTLHVSLLHVHVFFKEHIDRRHPDTQETCCYHLAVAMNTTK
jgi:hypothetical protein